VSSPGEGGAFRDAVARNLGCFDVHAEDDACLAVASVLEDKGVVLLGETHGVAENAAVVHWFVSRFGPVELGLEWGARAGAALQDFCAGAPIDASRLRPSVDGRITPQLCRVARDLFQEGLVTRIAPFVPEGFVPPAEDTSQNSWERALADRLLVLRDRAKPMIVLAGSVHALVDSQPVRGRSATPTGQLFARDPAFQHRDVFFPMGWHVAQAAPAITVGLCYGRGTFTNMGMRRFRRDSRIRENRLRYRDGKLTVEVREATAALVPDDG
jgi:hypothetical protein